MGDREHASARFRFVGLHPRPQVFGIGGVVIGKWDDLVSLRLAIAEDDVAVQVIAVRARGPFVPDQGRKFVRLIELFSRGRQPLPNGADQGVLSLERVLANGHTLAPQRIGITVLAVIHELGNLLAEVQLQEIWILLGDHRRKAQIFRVVGDDQEIQWTLQPRPHAGAGDHDVASVPKR